VSDPEVLSIAATTHGRVLVRRAAAPRGILAGFHGYLENAAIQLARLESIPGADQWTLVSVQGLHRVYRGRTSDVVASWMTSQDREDMIADNVAYVAAALNAVTGGASGPVVYGGFSQGVAVAFRAAVRLGGAAGIVAVGGDVPPELLADESAAFPAALLVRGEKDAWYTPVKHDADVAALRARGVSVESVVHGDGHEWTADVSAAAAGWLERLR
jgi:predicted esterase